CALCVKHQPVYGRSVCVPFQLTTWFLVGVRPRPVSGVLEPIKPGRCTSDQWTALWCKHLNCPTMSDDTHHWALFRQCRCCRWLALIIIAHQSAGKNTNLCR